MKIVIGKPYVRVGKRNSKICSDISFVDGNITKKKRLYFLTENKHAIHFSRSSDAFLVALLPEAFVKGYDIECESYISEKLYFSVKTILLPSCAIIKEWKKIDLFAPKLKKLSSRSSSKTALAFSLGTDASFSLNQLEEIGCKPKYLCFFLAGSTGHRCDEKAKKRFRYRLKKVKDFAKENNYKVISIKSNIGEFLSERNAFNHTFRNCACALTLEGFVSTFCYSSAYTLNEFKMAHRSAYYDILTLSCIGTEILSFFSTGAPYSRKDKINKLANYQPVYEYLDTCLYIKKPNCKCEKCIRTKVSLYLNGSLENFTTYDIEDFKNNFDLYMNFLKEKIMGGGQATYV